MLDFPYIGPCRSFDDKLFDLTLNFWLRLVIKLRVRFAVAWKMDISITEASYLLFKYSFKLSPGPDFLSNLILITVGLKTVFIYSRQLASWLFSYSPL